MISISRSPVQFLFVVFMVLALMAKSSEAKIVDVVLGLFELPSRLDTFADAPEHYAEKTIEFLAFGDAAMDYYQ